MPPIRAALAALVLLAPCACTSALYSAGYWVGVPFLYREAELPVEQVMLDIPYRSDHDGSDGSDHKHRLDLFRPAEPRRGGPILLFVHGGGWTSGDRAFRAAGRDVYRNIGRFFAARGVGTAVMSYRLQPEATWQQQVDDVAHAVRWLYRNAARLGADPDAIFVSGHSAGAYLATAVALDADRLRALGVPPASVCGLIPVSGAAFDLTDERTWELGASRDYYEERFRNGERGDAWLRQASLVRLARESAPPALILYAGGESEPLQRQSRVLHEALRAAGASSRLLEIPGEGHQRMVLTLSRDDKPAAPAVLEFIRERSCTQAAPASGIPAL